LSERIWSTILVKAVTQECLDLKPDWFGWISLYIINNYESSAQNIRYGISQGSILEPLLFLLYINDLPLYVDHSMSDLYADDTTIHFSSYVSMFANDTSIQALMKSLKQYY
jgi:hypothetical protein